VNIIGVIYIKHSLETGAYGTGGGVPTDATEATHFTDANYTDDRGTMLEDCTDAYMYPRADGGALKVDGSLEGTFRPVAQASLLNSLFGAVAGGVYTLDMCVPTTLQIGEKVGAVTRARNYYGVGVGKAEFTFATKEYVRVSYDWISSQAVDTTYDTTPTYSAENPLVFWRATLTLGTDPIVAKEATLSIDRALDDDQFVLGQFTRYRLTQTDMTKITGSITLTENQIDMVKIAQYGAKTNSAVAATNDLGAGTIKFTCLKTGGTAGCEFEVPVVFDSFDFKGSKVSEFGKVVNFTAVGSGFKLTVS